MKILGTGKDTYICEVTHSELEKVFDKYYGKLCKLSVGDEIDLGQGYSFRNDIVNASNKMTDSVNAYKEAQNTMIKFAKMVIDIKEN